MRRVLLLVVVGWLVGLAPPIRAQQTAFSYESITVAGTAIGFTLATINPTDGTGPQATICSGRLETGQIRYRVDGPSPSASEGVLIEPGDWVEIRGQTNLRLFLAIRTTATSGVLKMTCYR